MLLRIIHCLGILRRFLVICLSTVGRIGTKGTKYAGSFQSSARPDGVWVKPNETVSPICLFEAQLELRKKIGRLYH